jgi:hypothetical protein
MGGQSAFAELVRYRGRPFDGRNDAEKGHHLRRGGDFCATLKYDSTEPLIENPTLFDLVC